MQRFTYTRNGNFVGQRDHVQRIVVSQAQQLDQQMRKLHVTCRQLTQHPVPLPMKFIGQATSHSGQPMAVYACTFKGCKHRQGWVRDRPTGKPIMLWNGTHKK